MENIINRMRSFYPVSDSTVSRLSDSLTKCIFSRRHVLVSEGNFARAAYFLERGMTRSYWLVDGEEVTTSFSCEGDIVFSMDELYYGRVSEEFVETIEEVEAYRITLSDLRRLFETNIEMANWGRVIHQHEYRRLHQTHRERLTLPAAERYRRMQEQFPQVCRRANLGHIASYLGITLSTLSRIRGSGG